MFFTALFSTLIASSAVLSAAILPRSDVPTASARSSVVPSQTRSSVISALVSVTVFPSASVSTEKPKITSTSNGMASAATPVPTFSLTPLSTPAIVSQGSSTTASVKQIVTMTAKPVSSSLPNPTLVVSSAAASASSSPMPIQTPTYPTTPIPPQVPSEPAGNNGNGGSSSDSRNPPSDEEGVTAPTQPQDSVLAPVSNGDTQPEEEVHDKCQSNYAPDMPSTPSPDTASSNPLNTNSLTQPGVYGSDIYPSRSNTTSPNNTSILNSSERHGLGLGLLVGCVTTLPFLL